MKEHKHCVHLPPTTISYHLPICQHCHTEAVLAVSDTDSKMGKGESVDLVAIKRQGFSSTVSILVTNNTEEYLDIRKEWVKGGEAINRPVSLIFIKKKLGLSCAKLSSS